MLKNKAVIGGISILFSLVLCFGLTPLFAGAMKARTKIVRISKPVEQGEQIEASMIETVEVGKYNLPDKIIIREKDVLGKYARDTLFEGDFLTEAKISDTPATNHEYLLGMNGQRMVMSITIQSFAGGMSGKIQANDIISVLSTLDQDTVIPKELRYVKVLAVTSGKGTDMDGEEKADNDEENMEAATVTLLVSEKQAKVLAGLENNAKMHMALVYRGSSGEAQKFLDEQSKAIGDTVVKQAEENE